MKKYHPLYCLPRLFCSVALLTAGSVPGVYGQSSTSDDYIRLAMEEDSHGTGFGWAVSIDNGIALVGAPFGKRRGEERQRVLEENSRRIAAWEAEGVPWNREELNEGLDLYKNLTGEVYLFDAATGELITKLVPEDERVQPEDDRVQSFGRSVAIEGDRAFVSAYLIEDPNTGRATGIVYMYDLMGTLLRTFSGDSEESNSSFGHDLAVDNNILIVGARFEDGGAGEMSGTVSVLSG